MTYFHNFLYLCENNILPYNERMLDTLKASLKDRKTWTFIGLGIAIGIVYGILSKPFFLHLIDGVSMSGIVLLLVGSLRFWWSDGLFASAGYKKDRDGNWKEYRKKVIEERRKARNPYTIPGIILFLFGILLTIIYYIL